MKAIILSISSYKEKDAIVEAISEEGTVTFSVRSLFDAKSKNSFLNCPLLIADVNFSEGNYKYPVLKNASIILSPLKTSPDLYYLSSIMLIAEATKKMMQEDEKMEIYPFLYQAIEALKNGHNPWSVMMIYLAKIIRISGYEPNVNSCTKCGNKNGIVLFSFEEGGFICQNCVDDTMVKDLTNEQMLMLRNAFLVNDFSKEVCTNEVDGHAIMHKYFQFISDSFGVKLSSSKILL